MIAALMFLFVMGIISFVAASFLWLLLIMVRVVEPPEMFLLFIKGVQKKSRVSCRSLSAAFSKILFVSTHFNFPLVKFKQKMSQGAKLPLNGIEDNLRELLTDEESTSEEAISDYPKIKRLSKIEEDFIHEELHMESLEKEKKRPFLDLAIELVETETKMQLIKQCLLDTSIKIKQRQLLKSHLLSVLDMKEEELEIIDMGKRKFNILFSFGAKEAGHFSVYPKRIFGYGWPEIQDIENKSSGSKTEKESLERKFYIKEIIDIPIQIHVGGL